MSVNCINLSVSQTDPKVICHSIPCKVSKDCDTEVDKYFEPTIRPTDKQDGLILSSFRGRPLVGRSVDLPDNCKAFVVSAKQSGKSGSDLVANECFQRLNHWNLDKTPSASDSIQQTIDWIKISNAIHSPIVSTDLSDKSDQN